MALSLNISASPIGLALPAAYARILSAQVTKDLAHVVVLFYATEAARQNGARPVDERLFVFTTASLSGDILPAAYAALKALPEFAGAQDC